MDMLRHKSPMLISSDILTLNSQLIVSDLHLRIFVQPGKMRTIWSYLRAIVETRGNSSSRAQIILCVVNVEMLRLGCRCPRPERINCALGAGP